LDHEEDKCRGWWVSEEKMRKDIEMHERKQTTRREREDGGSSAYSLGICLNFRER